MTQPTTNRRDFLRLGTSAAAYAAGAAIVTGGVAIASAAKGTEPTDPTTFDRGWTKVVAAYTHAKADHEAAYSAYEDAEFAFRAPAKPVEPRLMAEVRTSMTIDEIKAISYDRPWREYEADLAAWEANSKELKQNAYGDLERAEEAAMSHFADTLAALKAYPVPTFALLRDKAALLEAEYGEDGESGYAQHIFADLRRLSITEA